MKSPILHFAFTAPDGTSHAGRIEFDWLGAERYFVDGELVAKKWSLLGTNTEFRSHGAAILIKSRLEKREAVTEVLIDGKVLHPNLMHGSNREFEAKLKKIGLGANKPLTWQAWFTRVILWAVLAYSFFALFKWLQRSAA